MSRSAAPSTGAETPRDSSDKDEVSSQVTPSATAATALSMPPALTLEEDGRPSQQKPDSETESEEEAEEPELANIPGGLFVPPAPNMLSAPHVLIDGAKQEDSPKLDELVESQDGISAFRPTPKKTYAKSRQRAALHSRHNSTASTIPDSDNDKIPPASTSFVDTPKTIAEAASRSVKSTSLRVKIGESATAQTGNADEDSSTHDEEAAQSVSPLGMASKNESVAGELDVEDSPRFARAPTSKAKKRKLAAPRDASEDSADFQYTRPYKAARQDESSLDEIVVAKPSTTKRQTPSRLDAQQPSTQQKRGVNMRSKTPATPASKASSTPSSGKIPSKVLLSGSKLSTGERSWLKRQTAVVEEVPGRRANFVCVVREKTLPTTLKVLRTLIADKPVVSDQWVSDSKSDAELLDPSDYQHKDLLDSEIKSNDRRHIWTGKTLFFTTAAARSYGEDWDGVQLAASEAGARSVEFGNANKGGELLHDKANTILFGTDIEKDRDAQMLLSEYSRTVYDRGMFAKAIIRAELDLDSDEFKLTPTSEDSSKAKKGRRRQ